MNACIIKTVDGLRSKLATGDFGENFVVPRMEPLEIDTIKMKRGQEFSATFSNLLVNGPSNFIVEKLKWVYYNWIKTWSSGIFVI